MSLASGQQSNVLRVFVNLLQQSKKYVIQSDDNNMNFDYSNTHRHLWSVLKVKLKISEGAILFTVVTGQLSTLHTFVQSMAGVISLVKYSILSGTSKNW